jgi:D-glycero-alpha-D-manno-heptose-7-phosphate kinase
MIISRTPFRVSLFGGGTDYPAWFRDHGGAVLGFAINKYCHISLRELPPFFEHRHRIVYSKVETVKEISEIQHPAARGILQDCGVDYGVEIHHDGDLPARSGLGSSSSFTVGLLNAVYAQAGRMVSKDFLAREAIRIEQDVIKENVGSQDQVWAAYGGMNRIDFHRDGSLSVQPVIMPIERRQELMSRLMLFFTGFSRYAHEIAGKKIANISKRESHLHGLAQMVDQAQSILGTPGQPMVGVGRLLHEGWMLKREIADSVSTEGIDEIYQAGLDAGAVGGKLLGAGGGGFILFYVEPEQQQAVRERLAKLIEVQFDIDHSGSRIVVYDPDIPERK